MNLFRTKSIEQSMSDADEPGRKLKRSLSTWDLMIMGVAVAVGAGIFSVGAKAAANFAGPAVTLSFAIAAVTCALAIMCYAEFATAIPVAGSAYVFTYATMGELLAWIIGWNLILELFTAGAVIAKYWGIYLSKVFALMGVDIPPSISLGGVDLYWGAFLIVAVFTVLLVLGTKLSARVGNIFTLIKIARRPLRDRGRLHLREVRELHPVRPGLRAHRRHRHRRRPEAVLLRLPDRRCPGPVRHAGHLRRRRPGLLRLHRLRRRRHLGRGGQEPAEDAAPRHLRRPGRSSRCSTSWCPWR